MTMQGRIVKGIGGFYYVRTAEKEYTLKAPGKFRKEGIKPFVGDVVEFAPEDGFIKSVLPRKNELIRPAVSNVTLGFIVLTEDYPKADLLLIDKLIIQCIANGIQVVLLINKCDAMTDEEIDDIKNQYDAFDVIGCSSVTGEGIEQIKKFVKGNVCFFAGQSGVGKSSLINRVMGELFQKTGDISEKLKRGKHTTRHVELVYIPELEGSILDTPGFSFYDVDDAFNIESCYKEFDGIREGCKFNCCTHINEPGCAVKEQVGKTVNEKRYERYRQILLNQKEMRKKKYD